MASTSTICNTFQSTANSRLPSGRNCYNCSNFQITVTQKAQIQKVYRLTLLFRVIGSTSAKLQPAENYLMDNIWFIFHIMKLMELKNNLPRKCTNPYFCSIMGSASVPNLFSVE
jgi:hypothetical protein